MIFSILTDIPDYNNNLFDCVSLNKENEVKSQNTATLDYMITEYPRNEGLSSFNFVYGLFEYTPVAFSKNQSFVIHFASELFSESEPLGNFESVVLNHTFKRLSKAKPTLSGRK
jgi:hypothetical protein